MGWNSWNSFANIVNSRIVQQQAKTLASNGMKEAGYEYVVIDEGWWLGERDAAGNIVVDPKQWPAIEPGQKDGDMANIAAYIHGLGLKAGIYTDAGRDGCSMYPDSGPKYLNTGSESPFAEAGKLVHFENVALVTEAVDEGGYIGHVAIFLTRLKAGHCLGLTMMLPAASRSSSPQPSSMTTYS